MSKTLTTAMQTHVAGGVTTLAWSAQVTRGDGEVFRYTSGSREAEIGGNVYTAQPGFNVSSITSTLGFNVDSLELTVLATTDLARADFLTGRWDGAVVEFNQYNWAAPADGVIPWPKYSIANVAPVPGGFVLELRDLRQDLHQDYTRYTGKNCPYRLGDAKCTVDLTSFTHPFTVTGVASRSVFTCSALAQAAGYFDNGVAVFDDGLHGGLQLLVLGHATGGVLTLAVPLIADIVIGQTGTIIAGCLKRFEDCRDKFGNALNFGGEKDSPTIEELVGG